jgi:hypothetical protein
MIQALKRLVPRSLIAPIKAARDKMRPFLIGRAYRRGFAFAQEWNGILAAVPNRDEEWKNVPGNPLWDYFTSHEAGHGIWKWHHYFQIYHQHFAKFIGKPVRVLEIGIFSGGSLGMWKSYFGPQCHIYGVDIEEACRAYASENVSVFIGDQEDPAFWDRFISKVPEVDIIIDDGGHTPAQQIMTLEKMLPRLANGGVYVCEDIHGIHNKFAEFASGLVSELNRQGCKAKDSVFPASPFQAHCHSVHFYPFVTVIERCAQVQPRLFCLKKGTEWQPFYEKSA